MHVAEDVWDPPTDLVDPDSLGGVPRQGLGRPMKVGKEELVGLLAAFDAFLEEDADATRREWLDRCEYVADELDPLPGVGTDLVAGEKVSVAPEVAVTVGADSLPGSFTINPMCLTDEEADYVVGRIRENLSRADDD